MIGLGDPQSLGATPRPGGVNFALFSAHAEKVELCLYRNGREEAHALPERSGDIWHGFVPGIGPGAEMATGCMAPGRRSSGTASIRRSCSSIPMRAR